MVQDRGHSRGLVASNKADLNRQVVGRIKAAASRKDGLEATYRDVDALGLPDGEGASGRTLRAVCNLQQAPSALLLLAVAYVLDVHPGWLLTGDVPDRERLELPDPLEYGMEHFDRAEQHKVWDLARSIRRSRRWPKGTELQDRFQALDEITRSLVAIIRLPTETVFFDAELSIDYVSSMLRALEELKISAGPPDDSLLAQLRSAVLESSAEEATDAEAVSEVIEGTDRYALLINRNPASGRPWTSRQEIDSWLRSIEEQEKGD